MSSEDPRHTRARVLQSEKMAAVGYLAAGLAYEINNPTAFVSGNPFTLARYIDDFKAILDAYARLKQELVGMMTTQHLPFSVKEGFQTKSNLEKELDLEFVLEDSRQLIFESKEGTQRIQRIVSNLKDFAQPGHGPLEEIDINACLESALRFVLNEIDAKPEVFEDFSELPKVKGYPQSIWLVFVNLLLNAAQAVKGQGNISIATLTRPAGVQIRIQDTGIGIAQEMLGSIFDPFFTTKPVGQGTGLGLSMAYNAIEIHGGHIKVTSQVGAGTTIILNLPLSPPEHQDDPGPRFALRGISCRPGDRNRCRNVVPDP